MSSDHLMYIYLYIYIYILYISIYTYIYWAVVAPPHSDGLPAQLKPTWGPRGPPQLGANRAPTHCSTVALWRHRAHPRFDGRRRRRGGGELKKRLEREPSGRRPRTSPSPSPSLSSVSLSLSLSLSLPPCLSHFLSPLLNSLNKEYWLAQLMFMLSMYILYLRATPHAYARHPSFLCAENCFINTLIL